MGNLVPILALMIPIVAILMPVFIVALALKHKRSEQSYKALDESSQRQIDNLKDEVKELKEMLHAQMITMDSLIDEQRKLVQSEGAALEQRIGQRKE